MLDSMSHPRRVLRVAEVPYINIHSRTGLVGVGIVNEKHLQLVGGNFYDAILAIVERWSFEFVCQPFHGPLSVLTKWAVQGGGRLRLGGGGHDCWGGVGASKGR